MIIYCCVASIKFTNVSTNRSMNWFSIFKQTVSISDRFVYLPDFDLLKYF